MPLLQPHLQGQAQDRFLPALSKEPTALPEVTRSLSHGQSVACELICVAGVSNYSAPVSALCLSYTKMSICRGMSSAGVQDKTAYFGSTFHGRAQGQRPLLRRDD